MYKMRLKFNMAVGLAIFGSMGFFYNSAQSLAPHTKFRITPVKDKVVLYEDLREEERNYLQPFRQYVLEHSEIFYLDNDQSAGAVLVFEKDYLPTEADKFWIEQEISDALVQVPKLLNQGFAVEGRITFYIYDRCKNCPNFASAGPFGVRIGNEVALLSVMAPFADTKETPVFHELAHLAKRGLQEAIKTKTRWLPSLSCEEGIADFVQEELRPGQAYSFTEANSNKDDLAREALQVYSQDIVLNTVGSDANQWPDVKRVANEIFPLRAFYFLSRSYMTYAIREFGLPKILELSEKNCTDTAYENVVGVKRDDLRARWRLSLQLK